MKRKSNFIAKAMFLAAATFTAVSFTACDSDSVEDLVDDLVDDLTDSDDQEEDESSLNVLANGSTLSSEYSESATLAADGTYYINGIVKVLSGATLYIEEGVELIAKDGDNVGYILIEKGGKIDAQGTASNPIVMTSEVKTPGAWGGLHICGDAPVNSGDDSISEVGASPYGGSNESDNSGIIKYVRLEYTGYSYDEDQECNGISFYGVGNGTQVSYVQAYRGSDDGFEFFGGTVNISYAVATSCSDDSFDWTDGWRGSGQFLVAYLESKDDLGYNTDCFLECDNGKPSDASPMSHPTLANVTMISLNGDSKTDGIMLKAGTEISLYNSVATGKTANLVFSEGDDAVSHYLTGNTVIKGLAIASDSVCVKTSSSAILTDAELTAKFIADGNMLSQTISYSKYTATSPSGATIATVVPFVDNGFTFEVTDFIGAGSGWMDNWTK
ncbi:MAG: hypothetical protein R3Y04_05960 [Rikenellaceae bacterium]